MYWRNENKIISKGDAKIVVKGLLVNFKMVVTLRGQKPVLSWLLSESYPILYF
jgi:hypothetical protein